MLLGPDLPPEFGGSSEADWRYLLDLLDVASQRLSFPPDVPSFRYLLRLVVPPGLWNNYANTKDRSDFAGASADETAAVLSGRYAEVIQTYVGSATVQTWAQAATAAGRTQIKADLVAALNAAQAALNGQLPWAMWGTYYDGTNWSS